MKKIFLLILALLLIAVPVQAQNNSTTKNTDKVAGTASEVAEKFYASLPQAKGEYKSRVRPILLEGAMNIETEILVRALKNPVTYRELHYLFVAGTYKDYPVVVVRTEQGMANAAASTALAIKKFNPIAVINQGTAGGHDPKLDIGDIVVGTETFDAFSLRTDYSPLGAGADFTRHKMRGTYAYDEATGKFQKYETFSSDPTLFNIAFSVANKHKDFNVVSGILSTSDVWLENLDYIKFLHETYGSSCEEMETASAAQICHTAGIPFIGIRVISNNVTINREYDPKSADVAQDFVLLVVESYIRDVLKK